MSVKVPPPGRNNTPRLPEAPPPPSAAPQNMATPNDDEDLVSMNFRVSPELRSRVKLEAVARNITMKDMCEAAFKLYFDTFPIEIKQKTLL